MKTDTGGDRLHLGRADGNKASSYAASLVELAKAEGGLDVVDRDLRFVKSALAEHIKLRNAMSETDVPIENKQKVIAEIFSGKVSAVTINFLNLLVGLGRMDLLAAVADEFAKRLESVENKVIAEVTTAIPLDDAFEAVLAQKLGDMTGRQVAVRANVDPAIVGGIVVRVGGKLLDGSIRRQFDRMRNQMLTR